MGRALHCCCGAVRAPQAACVMPNPCARPMGSPVACARPWLGHYATCVGAQLQACSLRGAKHVAPPSAQGGGAAQQADPKAGNRG